MTLKQAEIARRMRQHFVGLKSKKFPLRCLQMDFEKEILPAERRLIDEFGFVKEEINFIMRYKPTFILFEKEGEREGMLLLHKFFVEERGFDIDALRTLIVKYPYLLGKTRKDLEGYFSTMTKLGLNEEQAMKQLLDCPKLISKNLDRQVKEIMFLFNLYHGITEKQVVEIFMGFPYLFCCELQKIQRFMGEFRKYRFTPDQIVRLVIIIILTFQCKESGGILASKISNFIGLFDYFRLQHGMKAQEIVEIINQYPEFVYQNKKDLIRRKIELIANQSKVSQTFLRALIRRHPELFLKSWASMEAKVNYLTKNLGKNLANEKAFPLLFYFNYHEVIRPRCDLLKERLKYFELSDVLPLTDEQFCFTYGVGIDELEKKKAERKIRDEKDVLWSYVPGL